MAAQASAGILGAMGRFLAPFRQLRWKLTLSYTLVTVATLLVLEALVIGGLIVAGNILFPYLIGKLAAPAIAANIRPFLESDVPDVDGLNAMLRSQYAPSGTINLNGADVELPDQRNGTLVLYVLDPDGKLLTTVPTPDSDLAVGQPWDAATVPGFDPLLQTALTGKQNSSPFYVTSPDGLMYFAEPVLGADNRLLGIIVLGARSTSGADLLSGFFSIMGTSLLCFVFGAGIVGTVFGFFTARGLSRRLASLQSASEAWSKGNFDMRAADASGDEVGQLARQLNQMAEQLQAYMATRQELAAIEERNRLARELHDSVKQQIFATSMQLGAARELLERDPQAAKGHLNEAEGLAHSARDELTQLIRELRPAALEGKGLAEALREYVEDWSRQTGILASLRVHGERALPLLIEQTLFRVAQEALSNAARHSGATQVEVSLIYDNESVALTLTDNGRGFDPAKVKRGVGLDSMRERVRAIEGSLTVEGSSTGATVKATGKIPSVAPPRKPDKPFILSASLLFSRPEDKDAEENEDD